MYKARMLRKFFRVYARKIEKYNIALLATNHYTQKVGQSYGPSKVTTGGSGLLYAASVRLDLKVVELEIDKKLESLGASSVMIQAKTEKNRCFSPKRKVNFMLDFEKGVNRYSGLFKILQDYKLATKSGAWCKLGFATVDGVDKFFEKDFPGIVEQYQLLPIIQNELQQVIKKDIDTSEVEIEAMEEIAAKETEGVNE